MSILHKTLVLFSFTAIGLEPLEANSLEDVFNQRTPIHDDLKALFDSQANKHQAAFTLDSLAKQIAQDPYPALALFRIWSQSLTITENLENGIQDDEPHSPLDLLNVAGKCSRAQFIHQFIELCHQMGIQTRPVNQLGELSFDFGHENGWMYFDIYSQHVYFDLDNETIVSSEAIMDDPFLALRTKHNRYSAEVDFKKSWEKLATFPIAHPFLAEYENLAASDTLYSLAKDFSYPSLTADVNVESNDSIKILNQLSQFDSSPHFLLEDNPQNQCEMIRWQISADPSFKIFPSNFEQIGPFVSQVELSAISQTFFNANETYYFRVRGFSNGQWNSWSTPFAFTVFKPDPITLVEFGKIDDGYELNWERLYTPDPSFESEYLVFGSNALDFLPSIYSDLQINAMKDGEITEAEYNQNLVAITKDSKIIVDGSLAYYRIIVRQRGILSVPSPLIHVYDDELIQPRNVLQMVEEEGYPLIKRVLLQPSYPWTQISLPKVSIPSGLFENGLFQLHAAYLRASILPLCEVRAYQKPSFVSPEIWEAVRPHFLPENHPAKPKLDRMFSATRVIQTPETFRKAGFKRSRPGRFSRIMASSHSDLPQYFIKAFADNELSVKADWHKFLHRIEGAKSVREWIAENKLQGVFSVPNKWIYPLPENPSPPNNSHFLRKNFILVADNMRILEHEKNEKAYKNKMTRKLLDDIYRLFDDVGLYDSVYAFNVPFCKDGRLATIDTEYHHRWPVPFHKLKKYFSKDMQKYWQYLIDHGGPKGHIRKGGH